VGQALHQLPSRRWIIDCFRKKKKKKGKRGVAQFTAQSLLHLLLAIDACGKEKEGGGRGGCGSAPRPDLFEVVLFRLGGEKKGKGEISSRAALFLRARDVLVALPTAPSISFCQLERKGRKKKGKRRGK